MKGREKVAGGEEEVLESVQAEAEVWPVSVMSSKRWSPIIKIIYNDSLLLATVVREILVVKKFSYARLCTKIKCTKFFIAVYKVCMLLR